MFQHCFGISCPLRRTLRDGTFDGNKIVLGEGYIEAAERLGKALASTGADDRNDVLALRERPGDR